MATKENKGGFLKNDQVEQDLKVKGHETGNYGAQDTGDQKPLRTPRTTHTDEAVQNAQQDEED